MITSGKADFSRRGCGDPVFARQVDVHQDDVGLQLRRLRQRHIGIACFADHVEVSLISEESGQAFAKQGVVVNQQQARGNHACPLRQMP